MVNSKGAFHLLNEHDNYTIELRKKGSHHELINSNLSGPLFLRVDPVMSFGPPSLFPQINLMSKFDDH